MNTIIDYIIDYSDSNKNINVQPNFSSEYESKSYSELINNIYCLCESLKGKGLEKGSKVLFPFETDFETIELFLALIFIGAIPFSVKSLLPNTSKSDLKEMYRRIAQEHSIEFYLYKDYISLNDISKPIYIKELRALPKSKYISPPDEKISESDLAFVQFSSGSTGFPKGVPITHKNLLTHIEGLQNDLIKIQDDDIGVFWMPLYHDMGLITLLVCIKANLDMYYTTPVNFILDPIRWLKLLGSTKSRGTVLPSFGMHYVLKALNKTSDVSCDLSYLEVIIVGADYIDIT